METTTIQHINEQVQRAKERWDASNDAEKRCLIAQDIIDRLMMEQMTPTHSWGSVFMYGGQPAELIGNSVQVAIHAGAQCECCALGGIALSVIGFTNNADTFDSSHPNRIWRNDISPQSRDTFSPQTATKYHTQQLELNHKLHDLFSAQQLQLIEWCYEQGTGSVTIPQSIWYRDQIRMHLVYRGKVPPTPTWDDYAKPDCTSHSRMVSAQSLWDAAIISHERNDAQRMIAIMENIISNNGTFCPEVKSSNQLPNE